MSKREKLIQRFLSKPADLTWSELKSILEGLGYSLGTGSRTGGSRVKFLHREHPPVILHKPHPTPVLSVTRLNSSWSFSKRKGCYERHVKT